jgi:hypothetical protein
MSRIIIIFLLGFVFSGCNYYGEMNEIKSSLEAIDGVKVLKIWGHDDLTLEEIAARIKIDNVKEIVLTDLSSDEFNYPKRVTLTEIGGLTFVVFSRHGGIGVGRTLNIGTGSCFANQFKLEFESPDDVIRRYDEIKSVVDTLPRFPELGHYFDDKRGEFFIGVIEKKQEDVDPIFILSGIDKAYKYAESLPWTKPLPK